MVAGTGRGIITGRAGVSTVITFVVSQSRASFRRARGTGSGNEAGSGSRGFILIRRAFYAC